MTHAYKGEKTAQETEGLDLRNGRYAPKFTLSALSNPKRPILWMALAGGSIVCLVSLFFFLGSHAERKPDKLNGSNETNSAPSAPSTTAPATYPALRFSFSGKLPTQLHGFRLGMSVAEAMAEDPNLKNQHSYSGSGSQPPASDPDAYLARESEHTGFFEMAGFSNGRLTDLTSTVSRISPDDASEFDKNTLIQLGKPNIKIYSGPSASVWVWIDGDVRIRYENDPDGGQVGARTVALRMVVYPELIRGLLAERSKPGRDTAHWDADANLELNRHHFGEDASEVILKQLPTGLPTVRLRMTPSQVRSALPGIELIRSYPESLQQGELKTQNVTTDVTLWNGLVSFVGRTWEEVPSDQVLVFRRRLMEEFGTPSAHVPPVMNQFESITWEDEHTKIVYMFSVIASDKSHQIQAFYNDKQLNALSNAAHAAEPPLEVKPAPDAKSFF